MVRCPTDKEYGQWKLALESQTADNVKATYVRPVLSSPEHPQRVGVVFIYIICTSKSKHLQLLIVLFVESDTLPLHLIVEGHSDRHRKQCHTSRNSGRTSYVSNPQSHAV